MKLREEDNDNVYNTEINDQNKPDDGPDSPPAASNPRPATTNGQPSRRRVRRNVGTSTTPNQSNACDANNGELYHEFKLIDIQPNAVQQLPGGFLANAVMPPLGFEIFNEELIGDEYEFCDTYQGETIEDLISALESIIITPANQEVKGPQNLPVPFNYDETFRDMLSQVPPVYVDQDDLYCDSLIIKAQDLEFLEPLYSDLSSDDEQYSTSDSSGDELD